MSFRIGIAGTRGIPAKYGGFETFADELSTKLTKCGCTVSVYCDKGSYDGHLYQGVNLQFLPLQKSTNQVVYFFLSILKALRENDIVIVTSTAGSYFYWLNLFFRKKIITISDGLESKRSKWSFFTRKYLLISERVAMRWSNMVVADSIAIADYIANTYPRAVPVEIIEYGAPVVEDSPNADAVLESFGLEPYGYYLVVARLEPENNIEMMLKGFSASSSMLKCVVVGGLIDTSYVKRLKRISDPRISFIGGIYDLEKLRSLRLRSYAYLHGHSVGGTNPSLLEAMGCANVCICHDNPFNREVTDNQHFYFSSAEELKLRLQEVEKQPYDALILLGKQAQHRVRTYYTWENICRKYLGAFASISPETGWVPDPVKKLSLETSSPS